MAADSPGKLFDVSQQPKVHYESEGHQAFEIIRQVGDSLNSKKLADLVAKIFKGEHKDVFDVTQEETK